MSAVALGSTALGLAAVTAVRRETHALSHQRRRLIELAAGMRTAESSIQSAEQLFKSLGKETVRVKDAAGLTFPRILSLIINEAARSLEEGVATAEEIDVAMRLGVNYPYGPLG